MRFLSAAIASFNQVIALPGSLCCPCVVRRGLLVVLFLGVTAAPCVRAQYAPPFELKHFEKVGTVRFDKPDTLLIASIFEIDVDPAGRLLITDMLGEQVLLFDSTDVLLASLEPRICHPGFTFRPQGARFGSDEFIFLLNSGPWGYRFTTEGTCLARPKYHNSDLTTAPAPVSLPVGQARAGC